MADVGGVEAGQAEAGGVARAKEATCGGYKFLKEGCFSDVEALLSLFSSRLCRDTGTSGSNRRWAAREAWASGIGSLVDCLEPCGPTAARLCQSGSSFILHLHGFLPGLRHTCRTKKAGGERVSAAEVHIA